MLQNVCRELFIEKENKTKKAQTHVLMVSWMNWEFVSLNTAHTFSSLQYQVSTCIPPHDTWNRYCTSNIAKIHTNAIWQDLGVTFQHFFFFGIFQKKDTSCLSLIQNTKICTNIFRHFIYFPAFKIQQNQFLTFLTAFLQKHFLIEMKHFDPHTFD